MTVIFQLFCADDLKQLSPADLEVLRKTIQEALKKYPINAPSVQDDVNPRLAPRNRLARDLPPSQNPPQQINEALEKRFQQVSQQLQSQPPNNPSGLLELQQSQQPFNFAQRATQRFRQETPERDKERTILQWAISCEVNNFKFYLPLVRIKEVAYEKFFELTEGQRPKGPDSPYSPFNPLHPLYNLLNLQLNPIKDDPGPAEHPGG
jgi:hypothetical protein